jgi:hypothetical protein
MPDASEVQAVFVHCMVDVGKNQENKTEKYLEFWIQVGELCKIRGQQRTGIEVRAVI